MKISNLLIYFCVFFAAQSLVVSAEASRILDLPPSGKGNRVAFFIFGDSFFDPGNNNYINTIEGFRANYTPYGETFFNSPTGRFSDGRLIPDFIAEYAKLPLIPPYLDPHSNLYIHGVNFASSGGGALVETHQGLVIDLETQLSYFNNMEKSLRKKLGEARARSLLSNSVYLFGIGTNDYIAPFQAGSTVLQTYTETQYVKMVIRNQTAVLKEIYKKGGRKFALAAVPPVGCLPNLRLAKAEGNGSCLEEASSLARLHNKLLPGALHKLALQLTGFKYTVADFYTLFHQRIHNPSKYGFIEGETACCGSGRFRGINSCGGKRREKEFDLCQNPNEYFFFDSFHPNEKAYEQMAKAMWSGEVHVIKPYNLKQLFHYGPLSA